MPLEVEVFDTKPIKGNYRLNYIRLTRFCMQVT
jgi:hypothetical protein